MTPVGANERFRCYRYKPGQKFAAHYDGAFERDETERSLLTFMVYLNDDFEGGRHRVPRLRCDGRPTNWQRAAVPALRSPRRMQRDRRNQVRAAQRRDVSSNAMKTLLGAFVAMLVLGSVASAQPVDRTGADAAAAAANRCRRRRCSRSRMQPQPMPNYGYAPQRPMMQVQLTLDEQFLLERGYISEGQHIGGGLISLFFGWGIGQAIQGRWSEKGYIFTLGEGVSAGLMIWGMVGLFDDCFGPAFEGAVVAESHEGRYVGLMVGGLIGTAVFRDLGDRRCVLRAVRSQPPADEPADAPRHGGRRCTRA